MSVFFKPLVPFAIALIVAVGGLVLLLATPTRARLAPGTDPMAAGLPRAALASAPLAFELNDGQHQPSAHFVARGPGYRFAFERGGMHAVVGVGGDRMGFSMRFVSASDEPRRADLLDPPSVVGEAPLPGRVNYMIGADETRWRTSIPTYSRVRYQEVFPGIDAVFYGNGRQIEYDLIVAPGAAPAGARLAFDGVDTVRLEPDGELTLASAGRELRYSAPVAYQQLDGERTDVPVRYAIHGNAVSFDVGAYDTSRPLVIDPILLFSTYLGTAGSDIIWDVAVDAAGFTYVVGQTDSGDFPTVNPIQPPSAFSMDAFVTKLSVDGTSIVYSTFLGGGSDDSARHVAVDTQGGVFVAGHTTSGNYPTSQGAFQRVIRGGMDAFVTRLSPRGDRIVYSTFVGGSGDEWYEGDIAVDTAGNAYLTKRTYSFDFPTTPGALERSKAPDYTGVAVKLNPSGTALVYGTYLTGSAQVPYGIAVDGSGQAVIVGHIAFDMRTTIGSGAATTFGDGFIIRLNATGSAFVYSRRFGGSHYDAVNDVAVDAWGWAHVTGHTWSTDFMVSPDAFQPEIASTNGGPDAFVAALSPDGRTVRNATYLGGSAADEGISITVTSQTWVTVVGYTYSTDFPTRDAIQPALAGEGDAFVATLFVGRDLVHGTYLGGRGTEHVNGGAVDGAGRITVAGSTHSTDFPTTSAIQKTNRSPETNEGYVARVGLILPGTIQAPDVSIRVADDATLYGNWQNIFEDAVGRVLHNPDARLARLAAPLAAPADYFEFTVDGLSNQAWRMWIRGKAQNDSYTNDSVWVQFSNAVVWDDADQSTPAYQIGSTQGVAVVLEECSGCGVRGWGWQDNGYGPAVLGPVIEFGEGPTTVRVQRREDGISIDQIVFARAGATRFDDSPYFVWAPGYQMDDTTLLPPRAGGDPDPGDEDVLIYAGVDSPQLHGAWRVEDDPTAAGGKKIRHPNAYLSKITTPLASPTHYVEFSFEAKADVPYGFFIRGRADRDDPYNDSVHVQATNTLFPIGSTSAMTINLEQCAGTGLHGWMWRSSNYCNAPDDPEPGALVFSTDGPQTIRIQTREDGISIDQILMSRRYLDHGPHEPIIPR